ncbi:DUF6314 family protein [Arthrobacter sp. L77]|uniref:DUF6314 family protein n=1 Tax=Arthrobacter sp. L77 TaxID=1496689 RepID=UPI00068CCE74|nr:DUF6314 family protein [Arthrobacter sp. L77]
MQHDAPTAAVPAGPVPVHDPIGFLMGAWATERTLLDRAGGVTGTFTGTTTFTADGGGLRWDEQGTVSLPHFRGPASRSYRIDAGDGGTGMVVTFPDGRVLCRLDLSRGHARDEHPCTPDTYRVDFAVPSPDTVRYSWDVTGPAKDLLLTTVLTRSGAGLRPPTGARRPPSPPGGA